MREENGLLWGGSRASGPLSFMKGFDAFAGVIKSGGKTRRAFVRRVRPFAVRRPFTQPHRRSLRSRQSAMPVSQLSRHARLRRKAASAVERERVAIVLEFLSRSGGRVVEPGDSQCDGGATTWQAELARRILAGDRAAEEEFAECYFRRLLAFGRARIRQEDAARDLVQDVLLACLRVLRGGQLREPERLDAFVLSTARNLAFQHFRIARVRRREVELVDDVPAPDLMAQLENEERKALVASALRQMYPTDQEVLRLSLVDGLKPGQIADKLGLPAEVVRQRKSRALRRISEILRVPLSQAGSEDDI